MKQVANLDELNLSQKQIEDAIRKNNYNGDNALTHLFDLAEELNSKKPSNKKKGMYNCL